MLHNVDAADALALYVHEISSLSARFQVRAVSRASRLVDLLQDCSSPILVAWGEHEATAIPEAVGPLLTGNRASRRWCVVPDAAHWVQFERPQAVNNLLQAWFSWNTEPTVHQP